MKRNPYYDPDEDGQPANAIRTMEGHKSEVRIYEETALCVYSRVGFRVRFQPSETVYASFGVRAVQIVPVYFTKFLLYSLSRSKDATVNLWHVPEPIDDPRPSIPRSAVFTPKGGQGDLTSMHWNKDGTYLAVGSYDSVLRILKPTGEIYATLEKHTVRAYESFI